MGACMDISQVINATISFALLTLLVGWIPMRGAALFQVMRFHGAIELCLLPQRIPLQGSTWRPVSQPCASLALQPTSPVNHSQLQPPLLCCLHRLPKRRLSQQTATPNSQKMIKRMWLPLCQIFVLSCLTNILTRCQSYEWLQTYPQSNLWWVGRFSPNRSLIIIIINHGLILAFMVETKCLSLGFRIKTTLLHSPVNYQNTMSAKVKSTRIPQWQIACWQLLCDWNDHHRHGGEELQCII